MRLEGKVALVTGSSGGIGGAIVELFLAEGARVIACDKKVADWRHESVHPIVADITDHAGLCAAVGEAVEAVGEVDVVVANASTGNHSELLRTTTPELWRQDVADNLAGQYNTVDAVIGPMKRRGGGSIVLICSVNGLATFGNPAYSAARAGLISFTKSMAVEYGPLGIRANIVCPGTVRTPAWTRRIARNPAVLETLRRWYPLGRVAEPIDVARAV